MFFHKINSLILAILILVSTTGFTVHRHYCDGDMVSISVLTAPDHCCCNEPADKGCCHSESKQVKLDTDLQKSDPCEINFLPEKISDYINDHACELAGDICSLVIPQAVPAKKIDIKTPDIPVLFRKLLI